MLKFFTAAAAGLSIGASAFAQPVGAHVPVNVSVTLTQFDAASDTYAAQVNVAASACPDVSFQNTKIVQAKNVQEARDKTRDWVAAIDKDVQETAAHCGAH